MIDEISNFELCFITLLKLTVKIITFYFIVDFDIDKKTNDRTSDCQDVLTDVDNFGKLNSSIHSLMDDE